MALVKQLVPLPLLGGIDTKTAPQLVQPGSFLELENCFRERTGELRKRWGSTALAAIPFAGSLGNPTLARFGTGLVRFAQTLAVNPSFPAHAYSGSTGKWLRVPSYYAGSSLTPRVLAGLGTDADTTDPDCATALGGVLLLGERSSSVVDVAVVDHTTGNHIVRASLTPAVRPRAAGVGVYLCAFYVDTTASPPSLKCAVYDTSASNPASPSTYTLMNGTVTTSEPHFDVRQRPGQATFIVACRNNSGSITAIEFNPATGANVASATFAADANQCLGWLEDSFTTGSYYLATAGTTDGVRVRVVSSALAVTATQTIDATATANVRNVTGFLTSAGGNHRTFWEVSATPTYNSLVRVGTWTGAASVAVWQRAVCLLSKPYTYRGVYYLNCAYDSTAQGSMFAFRADVGFGQSFAIPEAVVFPGIHGGRTVKQGMLTTAQLLFGSTSTFLVAVSKKVKVEAENGVFLSTRNTMAVEMRFDEAAMGAPVEMGGGLYVPGGRLKIYDGSALSEACCAVGPEVPTGTAGTTGSLTPSTTYQWCATYAQIDGSGRLYRSAPSAPLSITMGASDDSASINVPSPRIISRVNVDVVVELWRTEGDGTVFYKVAQTFGNPTADTVAFTDTMSDADLADNELLYTTGGILENLDAPAFTAMVVYRNRLWGISAENRTEIWYSKELKPGAGVAFRPDQTVRVDGPDGDAFALAVLDDTLVIFKRAGIYVLAGDGPDDRGQGGYETPAKVDAQQGTINPRSVEEMPEGLMFEGSRGVWMFGSDRQVGYLGAAVEAYTTTGTDITAAVHVPHQQQVRFFTTGGRTLVWDYLQKQWYTFTGQPAGHAILVGSALYWCHPTNDTVSYENEGSYGGDNGVGYAQRVSFPHLAFAGVLGFQRVYALQLLGTSVGSHTVSIDLEYDYSGAVSTTGNLVSAVAWPRGEYRLPRQRCTSVRPTVYEASANTAGGFRLVHAAALVGVKGGLGRIPAVNRYT